MKYIDTFLNSITMYRLVLYALLALVGIALFFSFLGLLPYNLFNFLFSLGFLFVVSWLANIVFASVFGVTTNIESVYISALILFLIITPASSLHDLGFLFWAAIWTSVSKYMFAIKKQHIFNPVALGVALAGLAAAQAASWWVGTSILLPFVVIGGFLIVKKIRRFDMIESFLISALITICITGVLRGVNIINTLQKALQDSPIIFFASIMLTEPISTPPTRWLRVVYGVLVGILFAPQFHIGPWYTTPEVALLIGNVFSFIVSPGEQAILTLQKKIQLAPSIYDFLFLSDKKLAFVPGQYMEWTLRYPRADNRGNRRYFTIASSPTEELIRVGVKIDPLRSSGFKRALLSMTPGDTIRANQLRGDFTLPSDSKKKLAFIAGGIGVTPFRSIIQYLTDTNQKRDMILLYACSTPNEFAYADIFEKAKTATGLRTHYIITSRKNVPVEWSGSAGYITSDTIQKEIPDYMERHFYISGPDAMVQAYKTMLLALHIHRSHIITDYFPGF